MTKQQTVELLSQQLPGFYSVEQVIKLINDIDDSGSTGKFEFSSDQISTLSRDITEAIENEGTDIIDDYDLSMNYKEVELDSVDFDSSKIVNIVKDAIEEFISNLNEDDDE